MTLRSTIPIPGLHAPWQMRMQPRSSNEHHEKWKRVSTLHCWQRYQVQCCKLSKTRNIRVCMRISLLHWVAGYKQYLDIIILNQGSQCQSAEFRDIIHFVAILRKDAGPKSCIHCAKSKGIAHSSVICTIVLQSITLGVLTPDACCWP